MPRTKITKFKNFYPFDASNKEQYTREIIINEMPFTPIEGIPYKHDYLKFFDDCLDATVDWVAATRFLITTDLFFFTYFVARIPIANRKFWVEACQDVDDGPATRTLDLWAREHGKAVDCEYPVLTTNGWKKHGDLAVGDYVFQPNGSPIRVVATSDIFHFTDCYNVTFTDGSSVITSDNHLWEVWTKSRKRISGEKNKREYREKQILSSEQLSKYLHAPDERFSVIKNKALQFHPSEALPIPAYTLGAWLGDGTNSCGNITSADIEIIERIREDGFNVDKSKPKYLYSIKKLHPLLRINNILKNKHIPQAYLFASLEDRLSLLQGLMDTDGTVDKRGTASFSNINKVLIDGVYQLCNSLGLSARLVERSKTYEGTPYRCYEVRFQAYKSDNPFHLKRKLDRCKEGVSSFKGRYILSVSPAKTIPTRCIQVDSPDGLYLIGKNFITTHNSSIITTAETIQAILKNPEERICIFSFNQKAALSFFRGIKTILEQNDYLKALFPDVLYGNPQGEAPKWSEDVGLVVKRKGFYKEMTLEAWSLIEAMPTGKHFTRRIYDDVETPDYVYSPEITQKLKDMFALSQNVGSEGDCHRVIGTTYSHEGLLQMLRHAVNKEGQLMYHVRVKAATDDGTPNGKSVFLSEEKLDELRLSKHTFFAQQLLDPTPKGEESLNPDYITEVDKEDIPNNVYKFMVVDPAGERKDRVGDNWAIIVYGVLPYREDLGGSKLFILDMYIEEMRTADAFQKIVEMYTRNGRILKTGIEKTGATTFEIHVADALRAKGFYVSKEDGTLCALSPAGRKKSERIVSNLQWPLNNGRIFMSKSIPIAYRERLKLELKRFPFFKDDAIDALAYAYEMIKDYRFGPKTAEVDKYEEWWNLKEKSRFTKKIDGWMAV